MLTRNSRGAIIVTKEVPVLLFVMSINMFSRTEQAFFIQKKLKGDRTSMLRSLYTNINTAAAQAFGKAAMFNCDAQITGRFGRKIAGFFRTDNWDNSPSGWSPYQIPGRFPY